MTEDPVLKNSGQAVDAKYVAGTITVTGGISTEDMMPSVTEQPKSAEYTYGDTAAALTVTAGATRVGELTYQWYSNTADSNEGGEAIQGATGASYTPALTAFGTSYYYCVVTNTYDGKDFSVSSDAAAITYSKADQAALSITSAAAVTYGEDLALTTAGGSGEGEVTYTVDDTDVATVSGNTLTPAAVGTVTVTAAKAGDDHYNEITSAPQTITIDPADLELNGSDSYDVSAYTTGKETILTAPGAEAKNGQTVTSVWAVTAGGDKITLDNGTITAASSAKVGDTAVVTLTYSAPNHKDKVVTYNITVNDKNDVSDKLTFTATGASAAYTGAAQSADAFVNKAAIAEGYTGAITYAVKDSTGAVVATGADLSELTVTDAGAYTVTATYSDDENEGTQTVTFTIDRAVIEVPEAIELVYNGKEQTGVAEAESYTVEGNRGTNAGDYTATVTPAANYQWSDGATGAKTVAWSIAKAEIDVSEGRWNYTGAFTYDGAEKSVEVTGLDGVEITYGGEVSGVNAGTYTATAAVKAEDDNYTATGSIADLEWTIEKAQATVPAQEKSLRFSNNEEQTFTAADIKALLDSNEGTTVTITGVTTGENEILAADAAQSENAVTYALKEGLTAEDTDKTAEITISYESSNYADGAVTLTVKVMDKVDVSANITYADGTAVYTGEAIESYQTAKIDGIDASGEAQWTYTIKNSGGDTVEEVTTVGTYTITATYEDSDNFGQATVIFTVTKAEPAGVPSYDRISTAGKTLADANLGLGTLPENGVIIWVDGEGQELPGETVVESNKAYTWQYTPADTDNYNVITGTITPYRRSSGGGGSSSPSLAITAAAAENGTVKLSTAQATSGTKVTITATPDEGYEVDAVEVRDASNTRVTVTDNGNGTYTFTMPSTKATVKVAFTEVEVEAEKLPFTDVADSDWYADAVRYVYEDNLMNGTTSTTFGPNVTTSRGMIVTILYRLEGEPTVGASVFTDVADGTWYADAVTWASANGIVNGYGDGVFGPEDNITREQLAAILYRYAGYKGYDVTTGADLSGYTDGDQISDYAVSAISWANAEGLITGTSSTTLTPLGSATRAEAATVLMRFAEDIAK